MRRFAWFGALLLCCLLFLGGILGTMLVDFSSPACACGNHGSEQDSGRSAGKPEQQRKPAAPPQTAPSPPPIRPGRDRWLVKAASDHEAAAVDAKIVLSSIEDLLKLPRLKDMPLQWTSDEYRSKRAGPVEKTIHSVEADIVECQLMNDGDYRVVLRGASVESIAMEMPDPAFADEKSPYFYALKAARDKLASRVKPGRDTKPLLGHTTITGIGFFGRSYDQRAAPTSNLVQLHPVLDFDWQETASKAFQDKLDAARRAQTEAKKSSRQ